jgi:ribonuclease HII
MGTTEAAITMARGRRPLIYRGVPLTCGNRFENEAQAAGFSRVVGVDEVGRGALCGPVVVAAVMLGGGFDTSGLDDSKRLTRRQRELLAERVRSRAEAWALGLADAAEVDRWNVLGATRLAVRRAVAALSVQPDLLLLDALAMPDLPIQQVSIVKGDAQSVSIAAASVVAKVARDAMMREWDRQYPGYGLAQNMGYGSADHRAALKVRGPSAIHRRTFQGVERWLFGT